MRKSIGRLVVAGTLLVLAAGCSTHRPVLYPNETLEKAGREGADHDIAECMQLADSYVTKGGGKTAAVAKESAVGGGVGAAAGAVGGAIWGNPGAGAASGAAAGVTAGLLHGLFNSDGTPNPLYQNFVNTCLSDRGYRVIGWD